MPWLQVTATDLFASHCEGHRGHTCSLKPSVIHRPSVTSSLLKFSWLRHRQSVCTLRDPHLGAVVLLGKVTCSKSHLETRSPFTRLLEGTVVREGPSGFKFKQPRVILGPASVPPPGLGVWSPLVPVVFMRATSSGWETVGARAGVCQDPCSRGSLWSLQTELSPGRGEPASCQLPGHPGGRRPPPDHSVEGRFGFSSEPHRPQIEGSLGSVETQG